MKDAAEERKRKLMEQTAEPPPTVDNPFTPFEQAIKPRAKAGRMAPRLGIVSLGAVQTRPEAIDPLMKLEIPPPPPDDEDASARDGDQAADSDSEPRPGDRASASDQAKQPAEKRRTFTEESRRKQP